MTDEEKKAIEIIKFLQEKCMLENGRGMMPIYRIDDLANAIETLLNLIEKQSKEIEELKERNNELNEAIDEWINGERIPFNCVSNDKIKAKIEPVLKQLERKMKEEYNKYGNSREYQDMVDAYNFLQSLLEKE